MKYVKNIAGWLFVVWVLFFMSCKDPESGGPGIDYNTAPKISDKTDQEMKYPSGGEIDIDAEFSSTFGLLEVGVKAFGNWTTYNVSGPLYMLDQQVDIPITTPSAEYEYTLRMVTTKWDTLFLAGKFDVVRQIFGKINIPSDTSLYRPGNVVSFNATVTSETEINSAVLTYNEQAVVLNDISLAGENLYVIKGQVPLADNLPKNDYDLELRLTNLGGQEGTVTGVLKVEPIDVLYYVGNSTGTNGWDAQAAYGLTYNVAENTFKTSGLFKSTGDGFKLIGQRDFEPLQWGIGDMPWTLEDHGENLPPVAVDGYYQVDVNLVKLTYTMSLDMRVDEVDEMYVVGTATNAGDDPTKAIMLTKDAEGVFSGVVVMKDSGTFNFIGQNTAPGPRAWGKGIQPGQLRWGVGQFEGIEAPQDAGNYFITVDLLGATYSIAKQ
ncbi:hypothetical protein FUAX_21960 [Fulvitalea axinellae]|uniref:SusE outer membrane protein domain-containing protein n=2 Tax=Fulvitalea axinellae TaxID=1182444 RepID=A0AAU9CCB8_9BACT|nr:hypothetical protein FUAX_21960 [Fulvitalea axinellae]